MKNRVKSFFNNTIYVKNLFLFGIIPFLLELVIEMLNRGSVIGAFRFLIFSPVQFLCNMIFITISVMIGLMFKKRTFYITIISLIWLIMGLTNRILLTIRVTPFNGMDLKLIDTAKTILDQYFSPLVITGAIVVTILLISGLVFLFIKAPKIDYKINYWKNFALICIAIIVAIFGIRLANNAGFLSRKFPNLTIAYNKYGFVYCFEQGLVNKGVKKPTDYSKNKIDTIMDKLGVEGTDSESDTNKDKVTKTPNIIFLQLESFMDLNTCKNIEFNQDPTPYYNQLRKEFTSGYLNVFNVGYGTCNTEFEVMTSMNLEDFGPGEMPYKTLLKENVCESVAFDLKEYGYRTHAIHDNDATFYSRKTVFPHLGYDTFTSIEYMNVQEYTYEGWAKDKILTEEILKAIKENDAPDFIYTISVQGHGSYPTEKVLENPKIQILSGVDNEGKKNAIEYYANQINEMDEFVKELTAALKDCGEDTILVMYGDHLPGLGFSEKDLTNNSIYQTEYVIWNNFGMAKEDEDIRSYQLAPKVLKSLGMTAGVINKYHQTYKDDEEYLSGLQNLEYDILFGNQVVYGGVNPYVPTKLQMGIQEITISEIEKRKVDGKDYIYVLGENFTPSSKVQVNGKIYETEFIDTSALRIVYDDLTALDSFVVAQTDKDSGYVVGKTKECLYYGDGSEETQDQSETKDMSEQKTDDTKK